jgi:hypothetical protein
MRSFTSSFPYTFPIPWAAPYPLQTAQESASRIPHPKLVLSSGATEYTYYGPDTIISYVHPETDDSHITDILLNNADGAFTSLDLKGFTATLYHGMEIAGGYGYSAVAPQAVADKKCISARGQLFCRLMLTGMPNYLSQQKAKLKYSHNATSTKTVKDLITEIMDGDPVSESLYEQQTTTNANNVADVAANCAGGGQHLIIDARTVTSISFKLKKVGSPSGNITFHIAQYDGDGSFTNEATVVWGNASSLTTSSAWCEATLATPYMTISDDDIVMWWDHFTGDSTNYVSGAYNDFDVKFSEHYINILAYGTKFFDFISDYDCAYKYKYTYAGISVFEDEPSYEVVYDSEDSLIYTYCPAESLIIDESEDRKSVVDGLLWHTGCESRWENDGKLHVFVAVVSGMTYDSEYTLASAGHKFFDKSVQNGLVSPNKYVVRSLLTQSTSYTGNATSAASYALRPVTEYPRIAATSDAQCTAMAEAFISHHELAAQQGGATIPVNVAQELYDYILITDARAGDTKAGNIGALTVYYDSGYFGKARYDMTFQFGKPAVKSVPGAVATAGRSIRINRPPDDPYVKYADISEWIDTVDEEIEKIQLKVGIKKAETPAEILIVESLIGIQTQAGAQKLVWIDDPIYYLSRANKTASNTWEDWDISAYVPGTAFAVVLLLSIHADTIGNDDKALWQVRKAENTDGSYPGMKMNDYAEDGDIEYAEVIVGITLDKILQYQYTITNTSGTAQFDFVARIAGYFQTG